MPDIAEPRDRGAFSDKNIAEFARSRADYARLISSFCPSERVQAVFYTEMRNVREVIQIAIFENFPESRTDLAVECADFAEYIFRGRTTVLRVYGGDGLGGHA